MINFRYHLVSLAAVLIALAAGIALGSGPLEDKDTQDDTRAASQTTDTGVRAFEVGYAGRTAPTLLKDKLKDRPVLVLTVPGTSANEVKDVVNDLDLAGAEVTGEIALTSKILDSSGRQFAEGVARQSAEDVEEVTGADDSYGRIGGALARAYMADQAGALDETATTITSAFSEGGLITETRAPKRAATLAVLVTGPQRATGGDQSTVIAALAAALNRSGQGVVVAGPSSSSTDGGAVKAVREGEAASEISTVDVTDSAAGRVVTVLAAVAQAAGQPGSWGTSRSDSGALPK
ncbi:copper transporter [Aeromicrobium chenweiae]|uniref:copper transporter n=1 Tax=Aeromicrobium chenweiae TaxID=2079793 RepID=UPI00131EDD47|nr:copper transporter [Aeromicrobium chenweiae]